jgi:hypothetical protein
MNLTRELLSLAIERTATRYGADSILRTEGSTVTGVDTVETTANFLLSLTDWREVTDRAHVLGTALGACRYFVATVPEGMEAFESIALVDELTDEELATVRVVKGRHGYELQMKGGESRPTSEVHLILGNMVAFPEGKPSEENVGLVTWCPGRLTQRVNIAKGTVKFTK